MEGFHAATTLRWWPRSVLPLVALFHPAVRSLRKHIQIMSDKARPFLSAHLATHSDSVIPPDKKLPSSKLIAWLCGRYNHKTTYSQLATDYVLAVGATIAPPAVLMTHVFFELAARPEYVEPLREELIKAIQTQGAFNYSCLDLLEKMDSFLKECMRLNSQQLTVMTRRTTEPVVLPSGISLPKGVSVAVNNYNINHNPELFPDAEEFQGFRFFHLRQSSSHDNLSKYLFATTSLDNLNWGYGSHACPGRSFSNATMKLFTALILSNYDLQLTEGGRPENMLMDAIAVPDPWAKMLAKRRKDPIPGLEIF